MPTKYHLFIICFDEFTLRHRHYHSLCIVMLIFEQRRIIVDGFVLMCFIVKWFSFSLWLRRYCLNTTVFLFFPLSSWGKNFRLISNSSQQGATSKIKKKENKNAEREFL